MDKKILKELDIIFINGFIINDWFGHKIHEFSNKNNISEMYELLLEMASTRVTDGFEYKHKCSPKALDGFIYDDAVSRVDFSFNIKKDDSEYYYISHISLAVVGCDKGTWYVDKTIYNNYTHNGQYDPVKFTNMVIEDILRFKNYKHDISLDGVGTKFISPPEIKQEK